MLLLAACGLDVHSRTRLRFAGNVTPTSTQPNCIKAEGTLLLLDGDVEFAPDNGTWVLTGTATPDGALQAEKTREGSGSSAYETLLIARWNEQAVTGTYTTPRCSFRVALQRR